MSSVLLSRRVLLKSGLGLVSCAVSPELLAAACAVPGSSDAGMRAELHYVEASSDAGKSCSACAFFSDLKGACGSCQILNGPVSPNGHCDSWSART